MSLQCHYHIYQGDCLERLKSIPFGNCVDLIVTDPPYGLNFMASKPFWDKAVPPVEVWKECFRVLKPGGFAFVQCIPRQDCLSKMILNLQEAGFETNFTSLYWTFATGMNKGTNLSKEADKKADKKRKKSGLSSSNPNSKKGGYKGKRYKEKRETKFGVVQDQPDDTIPTTPEAKKLDGSFGGFQPKPATEVILCVMKPIEKVTREQLYQSIGWDYWYTSVRKLKTKKQIAALQKKYGSKKYIKIGKTVKRRLALNPDLKDEVWCGKKKLESKPYKNTTFKTFLTQALVNGKGCTWLGDCRIPTKDFVTVLNIGVPGNNFNDDSYVWSGVDYYMSSEGRFPANILVSDDSLNDGFKRTSGKMKANTKRRNRKGYSGKMPKKTNAETIGDSGSFSRYFDLDAWFLKFVNDLPSKAQKTFPFLIVPKPSKKEKNVGLEDLPEKISDPIARHRGRRMKKPSRIDGKPPSKMANHHPTVKPVTLMSYLITLGSRPGDIVLDPYCGSGTTGIAARLLNRTFIGMELNKEYARIAKRRIGKPTKLFVKKKS